MDNKTTVTVLEIIRANDVLTKISKQQLKDPLPTAGDLVLPFHIAKAIKLLEIDIASFESAKDSISERYKAEQKVYVNNEDNVMRVLPQYMTEYQNEITALAVAEVDKPNFSFKLSSLARNYNMTGDDFLHLMPWIDDDSDSVVTNCCEEKEPK